MGIDAVLSLNDGEGCDPAEFSALGLDYRCVPLPPNEPPEPGDEDICRTSLPAAYDFVVGQHAGHRAVLVHCSAGKDRTGLFMSYFLIRTYGLQLDAAIARVRAVQHRAMTALGWEAMARRVLLSTRATSLAPRRRR